MDDTIDTVNKKTTWCYNYRYYYNNWWHIASNWWTHIAHGAFFATVPIETLIIEDQQVQPRLSRNAAELQALSHFFGSIGIAIGSIMLAVGIGYLVASYGLLR